MTQQRIARTTLATSVGLLVAGLTIAGAHAQFEPQGLYSARSILDAEVHFEAAPDSQPSDVVDMLLGDDMQVHALVIRSHADVGQDGDHIVVTNAHYQLVTHEEDGETTHDVLVDANEDALTAMPRYDQDWWNMARQRARDAWHTAGEGAESAWHQTREGTDRIGEGAERAWERTQEGAQRAGQAVSDLLDNWTNND
ncbi:PRC-barrel domain containing protein [Billgrantia montanilacus]|uniref:PRC-barrel domain containing protein n=1 Tax=Billgrantia montanilacus TaxID=2282305 RepID=A0A368TX47_9GAMM|nr:PRC-barrel domain containing protein [Halomonas montanilacus]RCV87663.1 PRC-barrel domain containing protein [Halomonas montanilacus]